MQIINQIILDRVQQYIAALVADASEGYASYFLENKNTKTHRIIATLGGYESVHAFVDENGNLFKPAGWTRSTNKPVYNFLDDDSFAALLADASWCGRHLYYDQQSHTLT